MPKVTKQRMKSTNSKSRESVASRIAPVSIDEDGIRLTVYGRGKTGKTRFACTFPKRLLVIGTEKGTRSVAGVKGIDFIRVEGSYDIGELVELLKDGKYKSAVLDTAGGLQDIILREVLGLEELPLQKSWGMAKREDWATCGMQTKEALRDLLALSETHGVNIIVIAHERNFNEDGDSDLIFPTVGAALTPSVAGWLNGACDYVCQTFIREKTKTQKLKGTGGTMQVKTGEKEYCLRVGPHPVYMTGFRLPPGIVLPDEIVDPHFNKVLKLIQGKEI